MKERPVAREGREGYKLETKILRDYLGSGATRDKVTWAVGIIYRTVLIYIYTRVYIYMSTIWVYVRVAGYISLNSVYE